MTQNLIKAYEGRPPRKIISRKLKQRHISQRSLAECIGEHSQTLNAIIKGRRNMTIEMSVKLDSFFGFEIGFLYTLQSYYDVEQYRNKLAAEAITGTPNVRRILFWDVDFDKINWGWRKRFVISRVLERGTDEEKFEIARFYDLSVEDLESYRSLNQYRCRV